MCKILFCHVSLRLITIERGIYMYNDEKNKRYVFLIIIVDIFICIAIIAYSAIKNNCDIINLIYGVYQSIPGDVLMDIYLSQVSLTFITVSVITVLSDKTVTLYWKNLVEDILVRPKLSCLYSLVTYSISTVLISSVAIVIKNKFFVIICFAIDIFCLIWLTYSMLNVYFSRSKQKEKAIKEYKKLEELEESNAYRIKKDQYMVKLKENTLQALAMDNASVVTENIDFYTKYCDFKDVEYLLYLIESKNVEHAKHIILGFSKRIIENKDVELDKALERWNPVGVLPDNIIDNIVNNKGQTVWEDLFETIMVETRNILIYYCENVYECEMVKKESSYLQFRKAVRYNIDNLKSINKIYSSEEMFSKLTNCEEIGIDINKDNLEKILEKDNSKLEKFHNSIRKTPIYEVLSLIEQICKNEMDIKKKCYYLTVFISAYVQFPIFGYLYCLDVNYNNNSVFNNIINLLTTTYKNGTEMLNVDWVELYRYILGNKCGSIKHNIYNIE